MTTNISTVWDDPKNVDTLTTMWRAGAATSEIARAIGHGLTRNAIIGKVHRMKLQKRANPAAENSHRGARGTTPLITGKKGRSGNPGVPSVYTIKHRAEGRAHIKPPREIVDDAVDVTHLIAFADRRIGKECGWIPGDPLDGAMCCGKPVVEGSEWCEAHHARVYPSRSA